MTPWAEDGGLPASGRDVVDSKTFPSSATTLNADGGFRAEKGHLAYCWQAHRNPGRERQVKSTLLSPGDRRSEAEGRVNTVRLWCDLTQQLDELNEVANDRDGCDWSQA